ncbi:four-carbon acid sugar kinase family protein [Marinomonas agarivorans]|nr:four-carbon acid sugar kinase family protein [Marinomonas agarivorans]
MKLILGCIADDFTGATDIASVLRREGMQVLQINGVPDNEKNYPLDVDVVVVALKSRTQPVQEAVADSVAACDWLMKQGVLQVFFKYCSTFDSTPEGNIGPVTDALMAKLNTKRTIASPAYPVNGRTVYGANLFVHGIPLAESPMKDHPLTPMRDSNLVRLLTSQTACQVKHINWQSVQEGRNKIQNLIDAEKEEKGVVWVVDALTDQDLIETTYGAADMTLLTGGAALAQGLPALYRDRQWTEQNATKQTVSIPAGNALVLAGSCSTATRGQVEAFLAHYPGTSVDPLALAKDEGEQQRLLNFIKEHIGKTPILVYASDSPENVAKIQNELGQQVAGELVEQCLSSLALTATNELGVTQLVVAGGETSGAVVSALHADTLLIGDEIEPGVPWTVMQGERKIGIALKSGNFGSKDFFLTALNAAN